MASDNILGRIIARKREEVALATSQLPLAQMQGLADSAAPARDFVAALRARIHQGQAAVIAEIKKASPSKGVIREYFDPVAIARSYAHHGAACLSVLTDVDFFQGSLDYLKAVRAQVTLPILRKDFIVDDYQVFEARAAGADAILLIVAALDDDSLHRLHDLAVSLGMSVLVEVHDAHELVRALKLPLAMVGINNRNLKTFDVSLQTTLNLSSQVPAEVLVVTESGIHTREDVMLMQRHNVHAFLVGEAFMRADDPGKALAELFG